MSKRHYLVHKDNGDYQLKEIDPCLAKSMSQYGTRTGECLTSHTGRLIEDYFAVESIHWYFYFLRSDISPHDANEIAKQLTVDLLQSQDSD